MVFRKMARQRCCQRLSWRVMTCHDVSCDVYFDDFWCHLKQVHRALHQACQDSFCAMESQTVPSLTNLETLELLERSVLTYFDKVWDLLCVHLLELYQLEETRYSKHCGVCIGWRTLRSLSTEAVIHPHWSKAWVFWSMSLSETYDCSLCHAVPTCLRYFWLQLK
jgi:hypothetical protein